jgi:hypothetical protein
VLATQLAAAGALRLDEETAAETIWALASPDLYVLLTQLRGWSCERYAGWLAESLVVLLAEGCS